MFLSTILRRLLTEKNPNSAEDLCKKLENAVRAQSNVSYICRSFEYLLENMILVLRQCPKESLVQASTVLGIIGFINRVDFPIYLSYLTKAYKSTKEIRKYIMLALKTTIRCDAMHLDLMPHSETLLIELKDFLENAETADDFTAVSEAIGDFSKNYKKAFEKHFTDIVDIVVGWHLELSEQSQSLKLHCAFILQQFSEYFLNEMNFAFGLLGQFLEDIIAYDENCDNAATIKSKHNWDIKVGSFIGAFTSILKALVANSDLRSVMNGESLISNSLVIITKISSEILKESKISEQFILNINDYLCVIITNNANDLVVAHIEELIRLQFERICYYNGVEITSLLFVLLTLVQKYRTKIPLSMVTLLCGRHSTHFMSLKLMRQKHIYLLLLSIYREILMIKNVPLLQEAYKHIKADITDCMLVLERKDDEKTFLNYKAQVVLNFYLSSLSAIATQTSSIIGMYALNPSILELLIVNCKAANVAVWSSYSSLHCSLLKLLIVHCQRNHNFRPSSRLLTGNDTNSPTSENFTLILQFLCDILTKMNTLSQYNTKLLLEWVHHLIEECIENAKVLLSNDNFCMICNSLCAVAITSPLSVAPCLRALLKYETISKELLISIKNIATRMLRHIDENIQQEYAIILGSLPLKINFPCHNDVDISSLSDADDAIKLQDWYKSNTCLARIRGRYFKQFLDSIDVISMSNGTACTIDLYEDIFNKCWIHCCRDNALDYEGRVRNDAQLLLWWIQFEIARYCIANKLRTTIGKPQDTFLAIEAIIMKYVRIFAAKNHAYNAKSINELIAIQKKIPILLGFLENLEKHIYNAAEGTAFALQLPEKPARNFFHINELTCIEWFKRIRTGVMLIAMHSMETQAVIRQAEETLRWNDLNTFALDQVVVYLVGALLKNKEVYTLHGLYYWLKAKTGKRYTWIQFVAEQAEGRKERAIQGYLSCLAVDNKSTLETHTREFLIEQLLECMFWTGQWTKMYKFLNTMTNDNVKMQHLRSQTYFNLLENIYGDNNSWQTNENESCEIFKKLSTWSKSENDACNGNYSYGDFLRKIEGVCIETISSKGLRALPNETVIGKEILKGIDHVLSSTTLCTQNEDVLDLLIFNHVLRNVESDIAHMKMSESSELCHTDVLDSTLLTKYLLWHMVVQKRDDQSLSTNTELAIYLQIAARARVEENYNLWKLMLGNFFRLKGLRVSTLEDLCQTITNESYTFNCLDMQTMQGFEELMKYVYVKTNDNDQSNQFDAFSFGSACCLGIMRLKNSISCERMLLKMAEWIPQRGNNNIVNCPRLQKLLNELPDISAYIPDKNMDKLIPMPDKIAGTLLFACVTQASDNCDAWYAFGNWCYRWGKRLLETRNDDERHANSRTLSSNDLKSIESILGEQLDEITMMDMLNAFNRYELGTTIGGDDIDVGSTNYGMSVENELRRMTVFEAKSSQQIESVIKILRDANKSYYIYYEFATKSYFKYLAYSTMGSENNSQSEDNSSTFVTTTLRILRLIVKYAIGLQEVLEDGLKTTPLRPWKIIIPQLFSRLNHHESYVRKSVSELLCRLAKDRPHLIIFPTVVGANQEELSHSTQTDDESQSIVPKTEIDMDTGTKIETEKKSPSTIYNCFGSLLFTLKNQDPETVLHVQLLVKELKRISLLWEEYWAHSLTQIYNEYSPLLSSLESDCQKLRDVNCDILQMKYDILIRYLVSDIERIAAVTDQVAETNYERNFQERYQLIISNCIEKLKNAVGIVQLSESWQKVKELCHLFQHRTVRSNICALKLSDLSPCLANMSDTTISMPGIDTFEKCPIYIKLVANTVYILPTKTKPKKLAFFGSDGRKYTYLFKGLEDLHLDERIMQFLSISNTMMARRNDAIVNLNRLKAHHYSVIPLGSQSGLISWVNGVTPLFGIYKKWQQRDSAKKQQQKSNVPTQANAQSLTVQTTKRPSELFFQKLAPHLAEHNMKISDSRKQWPLIVLRRVLDELTKETPRHLISKEIWCNAIDAAGWRRSVQNYSSSVAVMSVIGYIIGLGDRHLDNILIKLSTGEILHIDYNVCFEKGKTLRVPEKVPFRMTPNIEDALGITGIEGNFRLCCEYVLRTLRKEKETLLTLLEAFVYDPLVDWTVNDDGVTTVFRATSAHAATLKIAALKIPIDLSNVKMKKVDYHQWSMGDWKVTKQIIETKYSEVQPKWNDFKAKLMSSMDELEKKMNELTYTHATKKCVDDELELVSSELAWVREHLSHDFNMSSRTINRLSERCELHMQRELDFLNILQEIENHKCELGEISQSFLTNVMSDLNENDLNYLRMQLQELQKSEPSKETQIVQEFLNKCNQQVIFTQANFILNNMTKYLERGFSILFDLVELIIQFISVEHFCPNSILLSTNLAKHKELCTKILSNTTSANIAEIEKELLDAIKANCLKAHSSTEYDFVMESILSTLNMEFNSQLTALNEQKKQTVISIDISLNAVNEFMKDCEEGTFLIKHSIWHILWNSQESFLEFENNIPDANRKLLLDHQFNYIEMVRNILVTIFGTEIRGMEFDVLVDLAAILKSMQQIKNAFELQLIEDTVRVYMRNDNIFAAAFLEVIRSPTKIMLDNFMTEGATSSLAKILVGMRTLFDEFEHQLFGFIKSLTTKLNLHSDVTAAMHIVSLKLLRNNGDFDENLKYETISKFLKSIHSTMCAFKENDSSNVYDIRTISLIIMDYLEYFQKNLLNGLCSFVVEMICNNLAVAYKNAALLMHDPILYTAQVHAQNYFIALQHDLLQKLSQAQVLMCKKSVDHYTFIASAHYWLNEQLDVNAMHHSGGHVIRKYDLLRDMNNKKELLETLQKSLDNMEIELDNYTVLIESELNKRLFESDVLELKAIYAKCISQRQNQFSFYKNAVTRVINEELNIWKFMKTNTIEAFLSVLQRWKELLSSYESNLNCVTPMERALHELISAHDKNDRYWMKKIVNTLDETYVSIQQRQQKLEEDEQYVFQKFILFGHQMQILIENSIRLDVRHLLRMMLKSEKGYIKYKRDRVEMITRIRELLFLVRNLFSKLSELQFKIISVDYVYNIKEDIIDDAKQIAALAMSIDTELENVTHIFFDISGDYDIESKLLNKAYALPSSPVQATIENKVASIEQKRNAHAVSVWKRVRAKLEGRDPEINRRSTVTEQIDYIIREAMNPDNLAVLFEGWTPWV